MYFFIYNVLIEFVDYQIKAINIFLQLNIITYKNNESNSGSIFEIN